MCGMRVRPFAAAALLGLLAAVAPASAGGTVYVTGRVVDGSGRGVSGARVVFSLSPDPTIYNEQHCPVRPWEIQCKTHSVAGTTRSDGRYKLPVRLSSYLASEKKHDLTVTDRSGAETHLAFYFVRKSMPIVDIPIWKGRASVDPDGPLHRIVHADALPPSYGTKYMPGSLVELVQGSTPVWQFPAVTEDRRVDARLVETGTTGVRAYTVAIRQRQYMTYRTPLYKIGGALRPVSRGATCATYGPDDTVLPLSGCRYTDGKLAAPIDPKYQQAGYRACTVASQCANPRSILVDLKSAQPVGALVVRGCVPESAAVSAEGTVFAPWVSHDFGDGALVGVPALARYVRVSLGKCAFGTTEISVFAPA